jgi:energy-coupling factor transporter transmembrane protein EcfT
LPALGWFAIPFIYVLLRHPPMYDGIRHFLFILPPVFVLAGIALDALFQWLKSAWLRVTIVIALLLPGIIPAIHLHPYQYTYYNRFVGGTGQASLRYETDYWLTCYKEAVEQLAYVLEGPADLFVKRESYIAAYYAPENITVHVFDQKELRPGVFILSHSRANPGLQVVKDTAPYFLRVERDGAIFCQIQRQ